MFTMSTKAHLDNNNSRPSADSLRVLQLISTLNPEAGGPPEGATQICRSLRNRGVRAEIITLDPPESQWGSAVANTRLGPSRFGRYSYSDRLLGWLKANAQSYDSVIVHGLWQYHGLAAWRVLHSASTPYYVFPHGMLDPWFKHAYPLKHLKKNLYWPWAEHRVLRDAAAVLFTTEEERQLARQSFGLYRVNEVVVGYGIADPPNDDPAALRTAFLQQFPDLQGKRLVLFLGRLDAKKGCDLLIDAFASLAHRDPALHLVMAGPDLVGYRDSLVHQAAQRGIGSRICWAGMLKGALKWGAFHSAEVFALPSHQENFGISVAEALACGVPVLISNKVNIWREVAAERAGLVADDTLAGTTGLLTKWLEMPATERAAMAGRGFACFRNHFHIGSSADRLLATIKSGLCTPAHSSVA